MSKSNGLGALAGAAAGIFVLALLPAMARHVGGSGAFSFPLLVLPLAGALLGLLLSRLLSWAGEPSGASGALLPWLAILFAPTLFLLPPGRFDMTGSPLGPAKHIFSAAWMLGVGAYACFLLPPLLREFKPARLAAGFTALALLVSLCLAIQPPNESDEGDYVAAALALSRSGTTRIDRAQESGIIDAYYFGALPSSWTYYAARLRAGEPVNRYSFRMIGYPLLLAPFSHAALLFSTPTARWFVSYLPGLFGYALLVFSLSCWLATYGRRNGWTLTAMASALPFLYFTTNTQPEIWMAAGVMGCLHLACLHRDGRISDLAAAWPVLLLPLLHERMAVFTLVFLLHLLVHSRHRLRLLGFAVPVSLPVLLSFAATQQFHWPTHAPHAYGTVPFWAPARWCQAVLFHLFSFDMGIFIRVPTLLMLFAAGRRPWPRGSGLGLSLFAAYFLLIVTYPHTFDSWPHVRYLVPALPALLPLLAAGAAQSDETAPARRMIQIFLLGVQQAISWPFLAVPHFWRWWF